MADKHSPTEDNEILPEDVTNDPDLAELVTQTEQALSSEHNESNDDQDQSEQLQLAEAKAAELKDQLLRTQAEMENVRRRAERDVEHAHKFGLEKFAQELLPVMDNLERALGSMNEPNDENESSLQAIKEGVEMTATMFIDVCKKFKLEQIDPEGEPFDPNFHEAMSMQENDEVEPNTVLAVLQKGYLLHGRLIRPAMVMVSKAKSVD